MVQKPVNATRSTGLPWGGHSSDRKPTILYPITFESVHFVIEVITFLRVRFTDTSQRPEKPTVLDRRCYESNFHSC